LLTLELSILEAGIDMAVRGRPYFYGYLIANEIKEREGARLLTAHGTLYRALDRMQKAGLLEGQWEDPLIAAREGRPLRRLYHVTAAGEAALADARAKQVEPAARQAAKPVTP
jgi:DNA-binding PadR family transcriptional regulator